MVSGNDSSGAAPGADAPDDATLQAPPTAPGDAARAPQLAPSLAPTIEPSIAPSLEPSSGLLLLLACGAGLSAASLYYNQPMLSTLAAELHASPAAIGRIPTLTQLGYAAAILGLAPLGDRYDRRKVILGKIALLALALAATAAATSLAQLAVCSVVIGMTASLAQDFVPAAATLAPARSRGKVVGSVMTGLLLGILLSRVASGAITQAFGWRAVFALAAGLVALLGVLAARKLPAFPPSTREPYARLLASLVTLWKRHAPLRRAALAQSLLSAAFSAFWSTLAVMLHAAPYHLGSSVAGAFGLAGAIGALAAPVAGTIADRRGPEGVIRLGASLVVASFAASGLFPHSLAILILATLVFDLGIQAALISHQSIVYGLEPAARSRLNAMLVGSMFLGMAAGSALGSLALDHAGWRGVCALAGGAALAALAVRLWPRPQRAAVLAAR